MLPSWTRRFSVAPTVAAGIAIGRFQVCAALIGPERKEGNREVRALRVQDVQEPLFSGHPSEKTEAALADALRAVSQEFSREFAAVRVSLPDTVIRSTVLDLDELPDTEELRGALLRWRFAAEWQRPEESLECRSFGLGEENGKKLLFGQTADRAWLDCVRGALTQAGIVPWSLNAAAVCRFNCFHDEVADRGGAMLSLDADCWNLLIWDAAGRVRRVVTRRRASGAGEDEGVSIADEVERAILAYVHGDTTSTVGTLFIAGNDAEMDVLASALGGRLRDKPVLLRVEGRLSGLDSRMGDGLAALALATALEG